MAREGEKTRTPPRHSWRGGWGERSTTPRYMPSASVPIPMPPKSAANPLKTICLTKLSTIYAMYRCRPRRIPNALHSSSWPIIRRRATSRKTGCASCSRPIRASKSSKKRKNASSNKPKTVSAPSKSVFAMKRTARRRHAPKPKARRHLYTFTTKTKSTSKSGSI